MYLGRFAPSPSGRLHGGSLLTGLSATLRALSQQGHCLTRIEDLDFPRCEPILTPWMLQELALLGLFPFSSLAPQHQPPLVPQSLKTAQPDLAIQSHNMGYYHQAIDGLYQKHIAFCCNCTRAELKVRPCNCAARHLVPPSWAALQQQPQRQPLPQPKPQQHQHQPALADHTSLDGAPHSEPSISQQAAHDRYVLRVELQKYFALDQCSSFTDELLGKITLPDHLASSLIIQRRDGIIAYNLAVVVDEHRQGITEVVRGADLLETTFLQLALYEIFGFTPPKFLHVPLLLDPSGHKLSKQNHAPAILSQLLPHQALMQAALQLNQTISEKVVELYQHQQQLAAQASLVIYNYLKSDGNSTRDLINLASLGHAAISQLSHNPALTQIPKVNGAVTAPAPQAHSSERPDPYQYQYIMLFLAAALAGSGLEQLVREHIARLAPCCDQHRGQAELDATLLSWQKVQTVPPAQSFQQELSSLLQNYARYQQELVQCLGHSFELSKLPQHALSTAS